jgi:hypothetical protein
MDNEITNYDLRGTILKVRFTKWIVLYNEIFLRNRMKVEGEELLAIGF